MDVIAWFMAVQIQVKNFTRPARVVAKNTVFMTLKNPVQIKWIISDFNGK